MIKLGNVIAQSNWDSGTHISFSCGVENPNSPYTLRSLDSVLEKEEIEFVEQMLANYVFSVMENRKK